ncbi:MAG: zinc ribbon domain-containing protein [Proteobacteria bacterium]|nr:zinc ribbon domain-containing protein [Pseudomonadota bacterium]
MPTYEFVCPTCAATAAVVTSVADRPEQLPCPQGHGPMTRLYSPLGFQLKGSGWTPKAS